MNRNDIIHLARNCFDVHTDSKGRETFSGDHFCVEELVALVTKAEREECAKVCDDEAANRHIDRMTVPWNTTELNEVFRIQSNQAHECAAAIRARGQA